MGKTYRSWQSRTGYKNSKHMKSMRQHRYGQGPRGVDQERARDFKFDPRDYR